jgi:3-oxoacyl-[acyl-carrier protein] reductase
LPVAAAPSPPTEQAPMARLAGLSALVTGASRGIGREIALRLAREGALVAVHYGNSEAEARAVVAAIEQAGGRAFMAQADLADVTQIGGLLETVRQQLAAHGSSGLDVLVNNAGVAGLGDMATTSADLFDRIFAVNVRGCLFVTQHALPLLNDGGSVINMSSVVGHHAYPQFIAYSASKAAIDSMTRSMAAALGPRKIRVNAISPGVVRTDMMAGGLANEAFVADRLSVTAMKEIGEPEDIASVAAFLAGPDARWITGERINVSGGMHL